MAILYKSVRVIKSKRVRWAGHVVRMEEGRSLPEKTQRGKNISSIVCLSRLVTARRSKGCREIFMRCFVIPTINVILLLYIVQKTEGHSHGDILIQTLLPVLKGNRKISFSIQGFVNVN